MASISLRDASRGSRAFLVLTVVAVLGLIWGAVIERTLHERAEAVKEATRRSADLTALLEEQTVRTLRSVDQMLRVAAYEQNRHPHGLRLDALLREAQWDPEMVHDFGIVDAAGRLRTMNHPTLDMDVSDREYFAVHRARADGTTYVGKPITGRVTSRQFLHLSRRLENPDGSFAGVVLAALNPEYLTRLGGIPIGAAGMVSIVSLDGSPLARRSGTQQRLGDDVSGSTMLRLAATSPVGSFLSGGRVDGIRRYHGYRVLEPYGLVVSVGLPEQEVMAGAAAMRNGLLVLGAIGTIATLAIAMLALVAFGRRSKALRLLADSEARHKAMFDEAIEGIYRTTPEGRFLVANPAMARILGFDTVAELLARPEARCTHDEPAAHERFRAMLESEGHVRAFEYRLRRRDGSVLWVSENARQVRDDAGRVEFLEGTLHDIGWRKAAEEAVRAADRRAIAGYEHLLGRLATLAEDLGKAPTRETVFACLRDFVSISAPCNDILVSLYDASARTRKCVFAWSHGDIQDVRRFPVMPLGSTPHCRALERGEVVVTSGAAEDQSARTLFGPTAVPPQSAIVVPMKVKGEVIGAMEIQSDVPNAFTREHVTALQMAAPLAAMAIENARLLEDERLQRQAAEESERRKSAVVESALDGIVTLDMHGTIVEFNAAAEAILGCDRQRVLGANFGELFVPPELRERHQAMIQRHLEGEAARPKRRIEAVAQRLDGERFPAEVSMARIGQTWPPLFTGFIRDITERHRAEAALRDSEERFRSLAGATADALWEWDFKADHLWWSEGVTLLFGYSVDTLEPNGDWWVERIHPDERQRVVDGFHKAAAASMRWEDEYRFRRQNGAYATVRDRALFIRDADGTAVRAMGGMTDVTERREAQRAEASLREQLRESQKMEAIGRLAGGVAHDFNNILGAILGNVDLAMQDPGGPSLHQSMDEIRKAGLRARDLVQQILSFSRRQPTQRHVVSLERIAEESVRLLRATLPARVNVELRCAPGVPAVLADATQMGQVMINLGVNAADAMAGRSGTIQVRLERAPSGDACLVVEDQGHGMSDEVRERVFEPFFTTKPVGEGTGLGLSVVHGIVAAHEGRIELESTPGVGTTFRIFLPASPAAPLQAVTDATPRRSAGRGESILYLDDDEAMVSLVRRMLSRRGYEVHAFERQDEALDAIRKSPQAFDLLVTDYNMPGLSGLDVAVEARKAAPDLPIAIASGYISDELLAQARAAGVREFIFKPDFVKDLCPTIERLLRTVSVRAA